ncbi:MAG: pyruvate dehydrogenase (acetyl-transferring) E1 component, alpha subunit [Candidatus Xenolissoclinum pacificiensis L6]|uniref:Pyruvate dehydrogenase E1 component subunit alpha n=1 Tax=Candidatus Xenolissoclinum pacificiensis L6 TaxID=1401685 RepID=W2UZQ7_9RICK|nr:MAG: pyruvate dehydrogenase (acetyl-transferring) E1 component, alpha subunit [Candidatus Xenolissoclinum pacificiensis L6]
MKVVPQKVSLEDRVMILEQMILIRIFEDHTAKQYQQRNVGGFCHLYNGQEAIACALKYCSSEHDKAISTYRIHGFMLVYGTDPKYVMAELLGRKHGVSKGKGGSMHMFNRSANFFGGHGIVGATGPLGTGLAFSNQYQGLDGVSFTCCGDGAMNQGQIYESFNMAKIWNLPVVYIIENNKYGMGTAISRVSSSEDLYIRGRSFEIPGYEVNGMDVLEIINYVTAARKYCLKNGPIILEMKTNRYKGHSVSDPAKYRSKEEVDYIKNNFDCIEGLKSNILAEDPSREEELLGITKRVKKIVQEAVDFALSDELPGEEELFTDIYLSS